MPKRPLQFKSPAKTKLSKQDLPLSLSHITSTEQHGTISGALTSLSPTKALKYFKGVLADDEAIIWVVGFDKEELQSYIDYQIPITLRDCVVQQNKIKGSLKIVLKTYTSIETLNVEFSVPDLKTVGSSKVTLAQISQLPEHERVTIKVTVIKMNKM